MKSNKFKEMIGKTKKVYGDAFAMYPATMVMIMISTLLGCIYDVCSENISSFYTDKAYIVFWWWLLFSVYVTLGFFCSEAFVKKWDKRKGIVRKIIGFAVSIVLSCLLVSIIENSLAGYNIDTFKGISDNYEIAWNMAYFVLILLTIFYCRYRECEHSIEKYFVSVFVQIVQICIVWGILAVGFFILSAIFSELIVDVDGMYAVPQILIIGAFVAPRFLMAVTEVKEEVGKFFEALIKYAMLIITLVGAGIIYIYMVKTLFTGIPSNEIFSITSGLFFAAIPVGFACTAFDRNTFLQKIAYVLPYIYAPFIILQCYSIFVRIGEYGVTPSRYMGVVLIVLEIVYTVVYAFFRKHIDKVVLVMIVVTVVATLIPVVNVNAVSISSQKSIITKIMEKDTVKDEDEGRKLVGAYNYICKECGDDYVSGFLSKSQIEEIKYWNEDLNETSYAGRVYKHYNLRDSEECVKIGDYDYVAPFNSYNYGYEEEIDLTCIDIMIKNYQIGPFDMSEEYNSLKERCTSEGVEYVSDCDEYIVSEDCKMIITSTYISTDDTGKIYEYTFNGNILFKDSYFENHPEDKYIIKGN